MLCKKKKVKKNYGALSFLPIIIFLGLYVGCGIYFTIKGVENPFSRMSRYVAVLFSICIAFIFYDRKTSLDEKIEIYSQGAGKSGVMLLGIIVLMAGAFSEGASAIGGKASMVNIGLSLIPVFVQQRE